jgi:hypothetical protein
MIVRSTASKANFYAVVSSVIADAVQFPSRELDSGPGAAQTIMERTTLPIPTSDNDDDGDSVTLSSATTIMM